MDQVKVYLQLLKKHYFWVMCGVIFITSTVVYSMGTSAMEEETQLRVGMLNGHFGQMSQLNGEFQPNGKVIDHVGAEHDKLTIHAWNAWTQLYYAQRPQLKWPSGLQFYAEKMNKLPEAAPIDETIRRAYHNVLRQGQEKNRFKSILQLYEELDAQGKPLGMADHLQSGEGDFRGQAGGKKRENRGLVKWQGFDQIFDYPWLAGQHPPSDQQMRAAQEDLWVYEFLLRAMAKINDGVAPNDYEKAWLKQILDFKIGRDASRVPPTRNVLADLRSMVPASALPAAGEGEGGGGSLGGEGAEYGRLDAEGGSTGEGGSTAMGEKLLDGRYCDAQTKPLSAEQAAAVIATDQYRLMPVRMVLVIDQRRLPDLMASLVNAVLPMRIRQIQLFHPNHKLDLVGMDSGGRNPMAPNMGGGEGGATASEAGARAFSFGVTVELRGMVYIFQEPRKDKMPRLVEIEQQRAALQPGAGELPRGDSLPIFVGADMPLSGDAPATTNPATTNPATSIPATGATPAATDPAATEPPAASPDGVSPDAAAPPTQTPPAQTPPAQTPPAESAPAAGVQP